MTQIDQRPILREEPNLWRFIGSSKEVKDVHKNIDIVLNSDVSVVIQGETGTGKELVAKLIHYRGNKSKYPFCAINCAAIPESLMESELLGHEKGSFTGAIQKRIGKFEFANNGTLFLDEINEMPITIQAKMLRVIEEQKFERIGGHNSIKTNVRIIAAGNKDLLNEVHLKNFREDLYYRIAVYKIYIPPLRERKGDIPELVNCIVSKFSALSGKNVTKIDPLSFEKLVHYDWPGNVRQLQNCIRRAILLTRDDTLLPEHFDLPDTPPDTKALKMIESLEDGLSKLEVSLKRGEVIPLNEAEEVLVRQALNITRGNMSKAAEKLGISRSTIYRKMEEYGIAIERS